MAQSFSSESPKWNWTTKLVVGLSLVAFVAWLILRFRDWLGPLILAFILTYLSYPVARSFHRVFKLSWRLSVTLFYLILIIVLVGLLTLGGLALLDQGQSLFNIIQQAALVTIPDTINQLSNQVYTIGRFNIDLRQLDIKAITDQVLATIQPALGQVGNLLTKIATSAASFLGIVAFILLISYFVTAESGGNITSNVDVAIPGYTGDFRLLLKHLDIIWNSFLRGQFILFLLTAIIFSIVLTILGVHYSWALALLSGLGRFLPYVGPFIAWTSLGLVAYFQGGTIFGLSPFGYVVLVVGTAVVIDSIFDNIISPKFMGSTLRVHPAAVLLTAVIASNVIGIVGVFVAAPALATVQLLGKYILRKMFDLDPWSDTEAPGSITRRSMIPPVVRRGYDWLVVRIQRIAPIGSPIDHQKPQKKRLPSDK